MTAPIETGLLGAAVSSWPARLKFAAGLGVTAILIWLIVQRVDLHTMLGLLMGLTWQTMTVAALFLTFDFAAKIARWRLMLSPIVPGITWRAAGQTLIASIALNNVLPFRAGDAARAFAFRDVLQAPASALLPLLVLERLLDTAVLVVLAAGVMIPIESVGLLPKGFEFIKPLAVAVIAGSAVAIVFAVPVSQYLYRHEASLATRLPERARGPFKLALAAVARQLEGYQALKLVALTTTGWLFEGAMFCTLAQGFHFSHPVLAGTLACALATLSGLIPSTPGAFGTFHAAAIAAVSLFGAITTEAAAYAVAVHAFMWLPITIAGAACLAALSARALPSTPKETA